VSSYSKAQSAGVLVIAELDGELCVAMSREAGKEHDRWVFPKGHVAPSESELEAARREVREETGLTDFVVLTKLGTIERLSTEDSGEVVTKQVHMFLGWCETPGPLTPQDPKSAEAAWKPLRTASRLVPFAEDREAFLAWLAPALE
jgi:bis(5'-nucleosidyl)-tetraphosphatase